MSVRKEALTSKQFNRILQIATDTSEEARRVVLLLRYTGMHVSVLSNSEKQRLRLQKVPTMVLQI